MQIIPKNNILLNVTALSQLRQLATFCSDPEGSYMAMRNSLRARLKVQNKIININLIKECMKKGVGLEEVEATARKVTYGGVSDFRREELQL